MHRITADATLALADRNPDEIVRIVAEVVIGQLAVPPRAAGERRESSSQSTTQGSCVFYEQHEGKSPEPSAAAGLIVDGLISRHCEEILTPAPRTERHNGQF